MDTRERHPPTEELLQLAAAELPVVIWQTDAELRFTASFGAALAGLKLEPGEVVGKSLFDFFQTADPDFPPIKIHREALRGQVGSQELHWSDRDFHFRVAPLRSDQGGVVGCLGIAHDITELRQSQAAQREMELRFRAITESTSEVVIIVSSDGTPHYISPSIRRVAGYDPQEVQGRPATDFVHADDLERAFEKLAHAAANPGKTIHFHDIRLRHMDGQDRHYEGSLTALPDVPGIEGILVNCRDVTEQVLAREEGHRSQAQWQSLVESAPNMVLHVDLDGTITFVNRAMPPFTVEQVIGTNYFDYVPPDELEAVRACFDQVLRTKKPAGHEGRGPDALPHTWLAAQLGPIVRDGQVVAITAIFTDITALKNTEQALRDREEKYRLLVDNQTDLVCRFSADRQLQYVSPSCCRAVGMAEEELMKTDFLSFIHEDDRQRVLDSVECVFRPPYSSYVEDRMWTGGDWRWFAWVNTAVRNAAGEVEGMIGVGRDITERKQAEENLRRTHDELELRVQQRTTDLATANAQLREEIAERRQTELALDESEERFRLAFEESPWGMTIIGPDGSWLQVNRAFCDMLGYSPAELVGMSSAQVTHPDDLQWNSELARQLVEGEIPSFRFEKRYIRKDGRLVWAAISATVVRDDAGGVLYGLTMVEDVTQRKQAQQALRRAERLSSIGTLAAGIAHEVNNPLGAIQLDAETALYCIRQPDKQETVAACLDNIAASAQRGAQIVKDVLRFARSDRRPKTAADLNGAVERACRLTRRLAEKRGVRIEYAEPEEELLVRLNSTEIEQVAVNLITNAVQASDAGNRVEISFSRGPDTASLSVRDFGRGMSPQEADRIFDPFFTTRENEGGTGLGLSISYGIVREHEGSIHVESCPGAGTTMIVRLPLATSEAAEQVR